MGRCPAPYQLLKKLDKTFKGKLRFPNQNLAMIFITLAKTAVFAIKFFIPLSFKKVDGV